MKKTHKLSSFFSNLKFRNKIFLIIITMISIALLALFAFYSALSYRYMKQTSISNAKQSFELSQSMLSDKLETINIWSLTISQEPEIRNIMSKGLDFSDPITVNKNIIYIQSYISTIHCPDISKFTFYLDTKSILTNETNSAVSIMDISKALETDWFNNMKTKNLNTYYVSNNSNSSSASMLSLIRIVANPINNYEPMGIIKIDFQKSIVENILNKNTQHINSLCYIQNSDGTVYASSSQAPNFPTFSSEIKNVSSLIYNYENWETYSIDRTKYMVGCSKISNTDLYFIKMLPLKELNTVYSLMIPYLIIILLLIIIVSYVCAFKLSKSVTQKITALAGNLKNINDRKTIIYSPLSNNDDVDIIIDSCNNMILEINDLINARFEDGKKIQMAEYKILREQINPHFLYNSLNLIDQLAYKNDSEKISVMIRNLSSFYRTGLSNGKDEISLKDELLHIQSYINIQNMKYLDKIIFTVNVPKEYLDLKIIKVILQPIVENSIVHGIMTTLSKSGKITINVNDDPENADNIIIEVLDDGIGIKSSELTNLISKNSNNFGLKNLNSRLKLYYGEDYGISISSSYGEYTSVKIKIPKINIDEETNYD